MITVVIMLLGWLILVISVYLPQVDPWLCEKLATAYARPYGDKARCRHGDRRRLQPTRPNMGDDISLERQSEADQIINMMNEFALGSMLRRGMKTWHGGDDDATIDLVL